MKCQKCNGTTFKPFDADYIICTNCSTLRMLLFTAPVPMPENTRVTPSMITAEKIRKMFAERWDEIALMRSQNVAWRTIKVTLGLPFADSTLSKNYKRIQAERGIASMRSQRGRFCNPGISRRGHKRQGIQFGAHI